MKSRRSTAIIFAVAVVTGALTSACRSTWVVVPPPEGGYSTADTLRGRLKGDEVRVTFRFDTIMRVDTVTRVDTVYTEGTDTVIRLRTALRVDTVRLTVTDTLVRADTVLRVDTVRIRIAGPGGPNPMPRVDTIRVPVTDTVLRVDTVRIAVTDTLVRVETMLRVDTVRVAVTDTLVRVDTVRVAVTDTVVRTETVRVPGQRVLFVPPGHYPPDGQCRVWIHDRPPGQQARAAACDALGQIPAGAFVLFGGDAWDFDYDWLAEAQESPGAVPPEIIALKRPGSSG